MNSFKSWIPGVTTHRHPDHPNHQDGEHELSSGDEPETAEARNAARRAARRSFRATRQRRAKQCATSNITGVDYHPLRSPPIPLFHRLRVTPGIKVAMGNTTVMRRLRHQLPKRLAQVRRLLTALEKRLIKNSPIYQQLTE